MDRLFPAHRLARKIANGRGFPEYYFIFSALIIDGTPFMAVRFIGLFPKMHESGG
jgi:hypothetical protein